MHNLVRKYGQFVLGSIFSLYVIFTLSNALDIGNEVAIATLLIIVLYIQSVGEFLYFYKKQGRPRLQDWLRLSLFIMIVLNFMTMVNSANGVASVKFSVTFISLLDAPFTLIVVLFSFIALDMAYLIYKVFVNRKKVYSEQYSIKRKNWVFGLLVFSTIAQMYLLLSGMSGYGSDLEYTTGVASLIKTLAGILNPFALVLSAYIIFIENSTSKTYRLFFYSALFLQVFLGLLSGMKENTLMPILYVGIVFLIAGKKIPKKLFYIGVIFLAFLYPINNAYRNVINNPYLNTGSHALNMAIATRNLLTKPLSKTFTTGIESYSERGKIYPYLQYCIHIESDWNYYSNMSRYLYLPVVWIVPRAIWPNKPRADIGGVLSAKIVGYENRSAVTPTAIGWAYLEGGLFFVMVIFILLGLLFEFIDKKNYKNPIVLLFIILLFHKGIKPEWDPYFLFASLLQMFAMYWILLKLIGVKKMRLSI